MSIESVELFPDFLTQGIFFFWHLLHGSEGEQRSLALAQWSQAERLRVCGCLTLLSRVTVEQFSFLCLYRRSLSTLQDVYNGKQQWDLPSVKSLSTRSAHVGAFIDMEALMASQMLASRELAVTETTGRLHFAGVRPRVGKSLKL